MVHPEDRILVSHRNKNLLRDATVLDKSQEDYAQRSQTQKATSSVIHLNGILENVKLE